MEFADDKAPKCVYPESGGYGYKADGVVENTPLGFRIRLKRIERPSMYGKDLDDILLSVEYHDESRLRIKVGPCSRRIIDLHYYTSREVS